LPESTLEKNIQPLTFDAGAEEGKVDIDEYKPNRIELHSFSKKPSYLLLNELYYPGWQAYVDGKKTEILRADYIFRAIHLDSGSHQISFIYRPLWFYLGALISCIAIIFVSGFFIFKYQKSAHRLKPEF